MGYRIRRPLTVQVHVTRHASTFPFARFYIRGQRAPRGTPSAPGHRACGDTSARTLYAVDGSVDVRRIRGATRHVEIAESRPSAADRPAQRGPGARVSGHHRLCRLLADVEGRAVHG